MAPRFAPRGAGRTTVLAPKRKSAVDAHIDSPTIQPDRTGYIPDPQDFAAWMTHPVTRFVARAFEVVAAEQRAEWMRKTWDATGEPDPLLHRELTTRADTLRSFYDSYYEDFVARVEQGKT